MEVLRSIKITVEVDTNKATYRETFDDDEIDVMFDWLKDYTNLIQRLVARLVIASSGAWKYDEVYKELWRIQNVSQEKATEDQLKERITILNEMLQGYSNGAKLS